MSLLRLVGLEVDCLGLLPLDIGGGTGSEDGAEESMMATCGVCLSCALWYEMEEYSKEVANGELNTRPVACDSFAIVESGGTDEAGLTNQC